LLDKVKAVQSRKLTDPDSCLEFLISYREALANSNKKKAYEAVNGYQQQVDKIIADLQSKKQIINASLSELVKAEDEKKLNQIYDKIKQNSELYQGNNNKKIIDNHEQRTRTAIKLETKPKATEIDKQLAVKLRTIVNGDSDKSVLENLQKELNEFKSASKDKEKIIYNSYNKVIDLMLEEIKNELTRREKSKKEQEKSHHRDNKNLSPAKKSTIPLVAIIASFSVFLIIFSLCLLSRHRKNLLKRNRAR